MDRQKGVVIGKNEMKIRISIYFEIKDSEMFGGERHDSSIY
jgi:hypothetical protein